jgi:hypothetical protein
LEGVLPLFFLSRLEPLGDSNRRTDTQSVGGHPTVTDDPMVQPRSQQTVLYSRDGVPEHVPSPSSPSSFTHVRRCIGSLNATRERLPTSVKLTYLSVYDIRDDVSEDVVSPSTPSSFTHVHRCIGSRNTTRQTFPTSAKLTSANCHVRVSKQSCKQGNRLILWSV